MKLHKIETVGGLIRLWFLDAEKNKLVPAYIMLHLGDSPRVVAMNLSQTSQQFEREELDYNNAIDFLGNPL